MDPVRIDAVITLLDRAQQSAGRAHATPPSEWRTIYGYAEDAEEQIRVALAILRADLEAVEADLEKQAAACPSDGERNPPGAETVRALP